MLHLFKQAFGFFSSMSVHFRLEPSIRAQVQRVCGERGCLESDFYREAVARALSGQQPAAAAEGVAAPEGTLRPLRVWKQETPDSYIVHNVYDGYGDIPIKTKKQPKAFEAPANIIGPAPPRNKTTEVGVITGYAS